MKLFHAPGSCSLGIRIILEEIGIPYDLQLVDLPAGEQHSPAFLAINPKAKVPALALDDGTVLTEFQAIATWLAREHPQASLMPNNSLAQARVLELIEYVVATLHMRGTTLGLFPARFVSDANAQAELRSYGMGIVSKGFDDLEHMLGERDYFFGNFSLADCVVFYFIRWKDRFGLQLPEQLAAFEKRMLARPSVQRALA